MNKCSCIAAVDSQKVMGNNTLLKFQRLEALLSAVTHFLKKWVTKWVKRVFVEISVYRSDIIYKLLSTVFIRIQPYGRQNRRQNHEKRSVGVTSFFACNHIDSKYIKEVCSMSNYFFGAIPSAIAFAIFL